MHRLEEGMSIETWLKEVLGRVRTSREARYTLRQGYIKVNNRVVRDPAFITGFLDIITLTPTDEQYLIILTPQRKLAARRIQPTQQKLSQVKRKVLVRGGRVQYTTREGYTFLTDDVTLRIGDAVIIDLAEKPRIVKRIPLEVGTAVFVTGGENTGLHGTIKELVDSEAIITTSTGDVRVKRENLLAYAGYTPLETVLTQEVEREA